METAPGTGPDEFSLRLSQAIAERGSTLQGLQARLEQAGFKVSMATLSYWSTGRSRPRRRSSQPVVVELERLLGTERGWLTSTLRSETSQRELAAGILGLPDEQRRLLMDPDLPPSSVWQDECVVHQLVVDVRGREKEYTTRSVVRALANDVDAWTMAVTAEPGSRVEIEPLENLELRRADQTEDGLFLAVLALPRPMQAGELVMAAHRTLVHDGPRLDGELAHVGYAVTGSLGLLVLEAVFEGELPGHVERRLRQPDGQVVTYAGTTSTCGNRVQTVVPAPALGVHELGWSW